MSKLEELLQELCPNGIEYKKLHLLAEIGTGSSDRKNAAEDGLYPFYVRSKEILRIDNYEYDEEAIIIPGEGGIGEIFHLANGKYALHQRAYRIHLITDELTSKFLYYYMTSNFKAFIMQKAVSATVISIRKPMIEQFPIPVPPLPVQREIVRILDKYSEEISALKETLSTELAARKKQYIYYCSRLLQGKTKNYDMISLSDIAKFTYGYTDKAKDFGTVRFVRITDIMDNGTLNPSDAKYIDLDNENEKYLLHCGDIVMARTGATYGKTLYIPNDSPAVYASFLIKITLDNKKILNRYYWHFAQSSLYWEQATKLVSTGGQPQFNTGAVRRIKVPVPSLEEQEHIVNILDRFDALCNDITSGLSAEIEARQKQYEYYRDKLLTFQEAKI